MTWGQLVAKFPIWGVPILVKGDGWRERMSLHLSATIVLHNLCKEYFINRNEEGADPTIVVAEGDEVEAGGGGDEDMFTSAVYEELQEHDELRTILTEHSAALFKLTDSGELALRSHVRDRGAMGVVGAAFI
jgi:hypothetical protein